MAYLQELVAKSIDYGITWCERGEVCAYECDWRIDPCLVLISVRRPPYELQVNDGGEVRVFKAAAGDVFLIPAGKIHKFNAPDSQIHGLNVRFTIFNSVDILSFFDVPFQLIGTEAHCLTDLMSQLFDLIGRRTAFQNTVIEDAVVFSKIAKERALAFSLLSHILECSLIKPRGESRLLNLGKIQPAVLFIDDNVRDKPTVNALAQLCGLSTNRFIETFKTVMDETPHQYLLRRKGQLAMALLCESTLSVSEIAEHLGFHDQPHFTKVFKGLTGLSPIYYRNDFRRRIRGQEG